MSGHHEVGSSQARLAVAFVAPDPVVVRIRTLIPAKRMRDCGSEEADRFDTAKNHVFLLKKRLTVERDTIPAVLATRSAITIARA